MLKLTINITNSQYYTEDLNLKILQLSVIDLFLIWHRDKWELLKAER
jgi:hypothetical protein